jgi:hypothetical protein
MAERGGFEPPVRFNPYNGLANRRIRPLCHLSIKIVCSQSCANYHPLLARTKDCRNSHAILQWTNRNASHEVGQAETWNPPYLRIIRCRTTHCMILQYEAPGM